MKFRPHYFALVIFSLLFYKNTFAQDSLPPMHSEYNVTNNKEKVVTDNKIYPYNRKRARWLIAGNAAVYAGTITGLSIMWYANYPRSSFHFFDDNNEWLQVDKTGHMYTAYLISRSSAEMWRWAGLSRKKRIWIGGLSGVAYQSIIEVLDGFSAEYGFSTGDFAANVLGSASFISQELAWDEQKIKIKFSALPHRYSSDDLEIRANKIFGESYAERLLKDYNHQTYWLSANVHSLLHIDNWPEWLNISIGYGARGMFGGRSNIAKDSQGNIVFDRSDIPRLRQWYLSPDLDFTKIKTRKKGVKVLLFILDSFKFPAPTLELSNGKIKGHVIFF